VSTSPRPTRAARLRWAALALLAAAAPASAQPPAGDVPLPPPPAGTRRVPIDVPLAPPPEASLRSRPTWIGVAAGPYAAFESGRGSAVTVDYGFAAPPPAWLRAELEWHLVVLASRPAEDSTLTDTVVTPFGTPITTVVGSAEEHALVIEAVPTARVRVPLAPGFAAFADGGLGLVQTAEKKTEDQAFVGKTVRTRYVTGVVLRLGAGLSYDATDRVRVVFEPLAISAEMGAGWSGFTPTLGLAFRL
jgi:opacity protein-like surface antigen